MRGVWTAITMGVLLLCCSCGDEDGLIHEQVLSVTLSGVFFSEVEAIRVDDPDSVRVSGFARPIEGSSRRTALLTCPPGRYLVESNGFFYGRGTAVAQRSEADLVVLSPGLTPPKIAMDFGEIELDFRAEDPRPLRTSVRAHWLAGIRDEVVAESFHSYWGPRTRESTGDLDKTILPLGRYGLRARMDNGQLVRLAPTGEAADGEGRVLVRANTTRYIVEVGPPTPVRIRCDVPDDEYSQSLQLRFFADPLGFDRDPFLRFSRSIDPKDPVVEFVLWPTEGPFKIESTLDTFGTPNFGTERWLEAYERSKATPITLEPGTPIELVYESARLEITADVSDMRSGSRGNVVLLTLENEEAMRLEFARTRGDDEIRMSIPNIIPGDYKVRIEPIIAPSFAAQYHPRWDSTFETATTFTLEAGEIVERTWQVEAGASIVGAVRRANGSAVTNGRVFWTSSVSREPAGVSFGTNPGGFFRLQGLPTGQYKLGISLGSRVFYYPGVSTWDEAEIVTITEFGEFNIGTITLPF